MKIKMSIISICLVMLFSSLAYGIQIAGVEIDPEEEGCTLIGDAYYCFMEAYIYGVNGKFLENIVCSGLENIDCTSNCAEYMDFGCSTSIELQGPVLTEFWYKKIVDDEITDEYMDKELGVGTYEATIDPSLVDYSKCTKSSNEFAYIFNCSYTGKEISFGATILEFEGEYEFIIFDIGEPGAGGADIVGFIWNNIMYVILIVVIAIVSWQVLRPKPAKKKGKRAPI